MNITKFTSVEQPFYNGYLFLSSISWAERLIYFFGWFLLQMSANDKDNSITLSLFGLLKLEAKGIKDVILLLIVLFVLLYAYFC